MEIQRQALHLYLEGMSYVTVMKLGLSTGEGHPGPEEAKACKSARGGG